MPSTGTSGKAARLVLRRQLEVARRGADLLSRKRQALLADQRRLREEAAATAAEWTDAVDEAERWLERAALLDGASEMARIASYAERSPELTVVWEPLMGVARPRIAGFEQGPAPPVSSLGGSSALHYAAFAYRRATRAAARQAAPPRSHWSGSRMSSPPSPAAHARSSGAGSHSTRPTWPRSSSASRRPNARRLRACACSPDAARRPEPRARAMTAIGVGCSVGERPPNAASIVGD